MAEKDESIAGFPPYERGYHAMGHLRHTPSLRTVVWAANKEIETSANEVLFTNIEAFELASLPCKSIVVSDMHLLPTIVKLTDIQYIYLAAERLLEKEAQQLLYTHFTFSDQWRILLHFQQDVFESMAQLRSLRAISAHLGILQQKEIKIPITCWVHNISEKLYALAAQADDLVCDTYQPTLTNDWLIANSLISKTIL